MTGQGRTWVGNIGPRERIKRLVMGLVLLAAGFGGACALIHFRVSHWWRYVLFIPLWGGLLGVLQALSSTCVSLAARGLCNMDDGPSEITDETLKSDVGRRAGRVYLASLLAAFVLTFFFATFL